jgi:hypothetical protein
LDGSPKTGNLRDILPELVFDFPSKSPMGLLVTSFDRWGSGNAATPKTDVVEHTQRNSSPCQCASSRVVHMGHLVWRSKQSGGNFSSSKPLSAAYCGG